MTNLKLVAYFVRVKNCQKQQLFGIKRSFVDLQYDFSNSPIIYDLCVFRSFIRWEFTLGTILLQQIIGEIFPKVLQLFHGIHNSILFN